jgi:hypothetical protein
MQKGTPSQIRPMIDHGWPYAATLLRANDSEVASPSRLGHASNRRYLTVLVRPVLQ